MKEKVASKGQEERIDSVKTKLDAFSAVRLISEKLSTLSRYNYDF